LSSIKGDKKKEPFGIAKQRRKLKVEIGKRGGVIKENRENAISSHNVSRRRVPWGKRPGLNPKGKNLGEAGFYMQVRDVIP